MMNGISPLIWSYQNPVNRVVKDPKEGWGCECVCSRRGYLEEIVTQLECVFRFHINSYVHDVEEVTVLFMSDLGRVLVGFSL